MSCFATMGCMIMPCLGLKPAANLQKTFMLDKMEPDRIFSLMVRLLNSVLTAVSLIALSLWYQLEWGWLYPAHKHKVPEQARSCAPLTSPGCELTSHLWWWCPVSEPDQWTGSDALPCGWRQELCWKGGESKPESSLRPLRNKANRTG